MKVAITKGMQATAEQHKRTFGEYPEWYRLLKESRRRPSKAKGATTSAPTPKRDDYEANLLHLIQKAGLPEPESQYRWFPGRQFRADFAYVKEKILIEVQGGIYLRDKGTGAGGGHNRGKSYEDDRAKYAEAQLLGFRVFEFGPNHITSGSAIDVIRRALESSN